MTTATIIIKDSGDSIEIEGRLEPVDALEHPPTPAVIIGSYLASHMEQVSKDAMAWFQAMATAPAKEEPAIKAPSIILPPDVEGAPV